MLQKTHVLLIANSEDSFEASDEKAMHMFLYPEKDCWTKSQQNKICKS